MTNKTLIFGHRGVPVKFPENSLAGFKYALDHGIDGLEFDVHLTKDNIPVIIHDETINRTTNGSGRVVDFTKSELSSFRLSNGERIPTLSEVLKLLQFQPVYINLEFKTDQIHYPGIEKKVLALTQQAKLIHPVIFSSFDLQTLRICREIDAHQSYNLLSSSKRIKDPKNFVINEGLTGLHTSHYQFSSVLQRSWTVNNALKAFLLLTFGVSGIITGQVQNVGVN